MVQLASEAAVNERDTMYYVVAYAKVVVDKNGIDLQGIFFGGITDSEKEANRIADECNSRVKSGTILIKIIQTEEHVILDALSEAIKKFEIIISQMQEAERIINRTQGIKP